MSSDLTDGWLFDLYPSGDRIVLWIAADDGRRLRLTQPFAPLLYVGRDRPRGLERERLRAAIEASAGLEWLGPATGRDFWLDHPIEVDAVRVTDLDRYAGNLRELARRFPDATLYNCDIPPEVHFCYERGLYPTARARFSHTGGNLESVERLGDPRAIEYELTGLRVAELAAEGARPHPRPRLRSLSLTIEGRTLCWEDAPPRAMLASLRDALREHDPDLIWTTGGDAELMPTILGLADACRVELGLDREPGVRRRLDARGRTFISYGQVLYHAPDFPLLGRWHIDRANSFWARKTGLEGLVEVARMARMPIQRAARRSIGTGITSIQLDLAYREGYLIPWKKVRPEAWKSADLLLRADRGGLVYQPRLGVHEDVVELDFVSMYPTIMVRCNISPETLDCACCPPRPAVPELGYSICRRRRGLIPRAIKPVIDRRALTKRLMKKAALAGDQERREQLSRRQEALKWLLVCCFGYLGYRNARFGRIEAHEATTAFSREKLLAARELCEQQGFRVLHSIVDCVWIHKPGADPAEISELCSRIDRATNLKIAVEGRYDWLVFLPSRQDPGMPVPNRYFGRFSDGKLKYRGIEIRRGDQCPFVRELQGELLAMLAEADSLAGCRALRPRLVEAVRAAERALREHRVDLERLLIRRKTSREAEQYRGGQAVAVAARQTRRAGIELHAGEAVRYLVTSAGDADPDSRVRIMPLLGGGDSYDVDYYVEQVRRAAATVLEPLLGEPIERLLELPPPPKRRVRRPRPPDDPRISQPSFL